MTCRPSILRQRLPELGNTDHEIISYSLNELANFPSPKFLATWFRL